MRRRFIFIGLVLVISIVAACSGGAVDSGDDQMPSISFDGTAAYYSGPSEVAAYPPVQEFRLVNDSDVSVDFVYAPIKTDEFEGVTEQDAIDWGLNPDNSGKQPPWIGNPGYFRRHVLAGETLEVGAAFVAGQTYELTVLSPATQTGHFAAWVDAVAADD